MIRIVIGLSLVLSSSLLTAKPLSQSTAYLMPCFNINEVEPIGKQIRELLTNEFCKRKVDPKHFASISQNILPQIMTESFLGVTPPENWQQLTDNIIKDCLKDHDLCRKEARKEFEACVKPIIPLILIQFGPWLAEHCSQLNKSIIKQWSHKKALLQKTIEAHVGIYNR